ncbi:hypothetical protein KDAU_42970 [Dictyobacter aurantiacus]|uniref:Peptidase S53 domain-containing protein n=1 Tax=Dictyobacter aurantiacus TaxID=1936993 RepID=A0A401ZJG4_9CHLR|nr:hypothetical protein KDAU_42970 [Dictyobacter aurantiacus]
MDMEKVSAIAPGAQQRIYIGPNTTAGVNETFNQIVTENVARVVSTSWGVCEPAADEANLRELDMIFREGAAQGQAFFAASGDQGAYDCQNQDLAVDVPANEPFVIGVGGTTLYTGDHGEYIRETAWHTLDTPMSYGGGGGISSIFSRPAYQKGLGPAIDNRLVPDVSANADSYFGFQAYFTTTGPDPSGWYRIGGTSIAAPLWAALAIDVNQYLISQRCQPLGHANALLYRLAAMKRPYLAFHDITEGNNLYYLAGPGYDLATGLGSPDAWNLARDAVAICAHT